MTRVGPSYLYPNHAVAPGVVNPDITQVNIGQTICNSQWSTKSIRPPVSYTNNLKKQQLAAAHASDKDLSHWEEDHLVSLELGGHPRDPKNLWVAVGHARAAAHIPGFVPGPYGRSQRQGQNGESAPPRGLQRHADTAGGAVHHRHRLVQYYREKVLK